MVEATLSPSVHMASLGGPSERERRAEEVSNPPGHPHITESLSPNPSARTGDAGTPTQIHCPAQDKAQPFSKESSGWESQQVCSHLMFLCEHCISLNISGKTQKTAGFLRTATPWVGHARGTKGTFPMQCAWQ